MAIPRTPRKQVPEHLRYQVLVPHGYKTRAQEYCRKLLGAPYWDYTPFGGYKVNNESATWTYDSRDGSLWFQDEANTSLLTVVVLQKGKK